MPVATMTSKSAPEIRAGRTLALLASTPGHRNVRVVLNDDRASICLCNKWGTCRIRSDRCRHTGATGSPPSSLSGLRRHQLAASCVEAFRCPSVGSFEARHRRRLCGRTGMQKRLVEDTITKLLPRSEDERLHKPCKERRLQSHYPNGRQQDGPASCRGVGHVIEFP